MVLKKYGLLLNPGHNRVYYKASQQMSLAEFEITAQKMECSVNEVKGELIAGVYYLTFTCENELSEKDLDKIAGLSFVFALFRMEGETLIPVLIPKADLTDVNLSSMLKYTGKTNEIFTRMMINVAVSSCKMAEPERINLLDPIAGKGTTLFEGITMGYDASGIEIGDKAAAESYHYLKKYLEIERIKHKANPHKQKEADKKFTCMHYEIDLGKTKDAFKKHEEQHWHLVCGNSLYADHYFGKNKFHILVGDLPYGVQHGNVTAEKQSSFTRNPKELVKACLPAWKKVLKTGGVIVLSWNTHVLPKAQLAEVFEEAGFEVLLEGPYDKFMHRVDNSIMRDIIVARK